MTRAETCGAAGGAISLWVNVIGCIGDGGLVSSGTWGRSGSLIDCQNGLIRYDSFIFSVPDDHITDRTTVSSHCFHVIESLVVF